MAPFDLDACIEQLLRKQLLHEALLREICEKTKEVLMRESNVVHVSAPVTVVGDIHGQFYDLIEIFRIGGYAPHTNYLFLGDYVDRGLFSVETISLLTCLKLRWPDRVQLIRGNHESRAVTQVGLFSFSFALNFEVFRHTGFIRSVYGSMGLHTCGPISRTCLTS